MHCSKTVYVCVCMYVAIQMKLSWTNRALVNLPNHSNTLTVQVATFIGHIICHMVTPEACMCFHVKVPYMYNVSLSTFCLLPLLISAMLFVVASYPSIQQQVVYSIARVQNRVGAIIH